MNIHKDDIDEIQQEELSSDEYLLGSCADWFIADMTELPVKSVEAIQKAGAYEALGQMIKSVCGVDKFQQGIVTNDGYGPHFGHYDGYEYEAGNYYVFRGN